MSTINRNNYEFFEFINRVPEGLHTYYNRRYDRFESHYTSQGDRMHDLSKAPCLYYLKSQIWDKFYSLLSEEEYEIATSYPYKRGYFNYLKETGLFEIYEAAEEIVAFKALSDWLTVNNLYHLLLTDTKDC